MRDSNLFAVRSRSERIEIVFVGMSEVFGSIFFLVFLFVVIVVGKFKVCKNKRYFISSAMVRGHELGKRDYYLAT